MGEIEKIPIFPIFLTKNTHDLLVFCLSLQHKTNYLLQYIVSKMAANNLKEQTQQLVSRFCAGDDQAFAKLYDLYVQMLYNYGLKLTSNQELLKDCIHDVFMKVYSKRGEKAGINNLASYLIISLKNRLFDEFRRQTFTSEDAVEDYEFRYSTSDVERDYLHTELEKI